MFRRALQESFSLGWRRVNSALFCLELQEHVAYGQHGREVRFGPSVGFYVAQAVDFEVNVNEAPVVTDRVPFASPRVVVDSAVWLDVVVKEKPHVRRGNVAHPPLGECVVDRQPVEGKTPVVLSTVRPVRRPKAVVCLPQQKDKSTKTREWKSVLSNDPQWMTLWGSLSRLRNPFDYGATEAYPTCKLIPPNIKNRTEKIDN